MTGRGMDRPSLKGMVCATLAAATAPLLPFLLFLLAGPVGFVMLVFAVIIGLPIALASALVGMAAYLLLMRRWTIRWWLAGAAGFVIGAVAGIVFEAFRPLFQGVYLIGPAYLFTSTIFGLLGAIGGLAFHLELGISQIIEASGPSSGKPATQGARRRAAGRTCRRLAASARRSACRW